MTEMSAKAHKEDSQLTHFMRAHDWKAAWVALGGVVVLLVDRIH